MQRAFRLRRAEHLASLEERILLLENENSQLRLLLNLPDADRGRIGSGPTGRGKSLKEGGVPMSERVRARKEARARERRAKGIAAGHESSDDVDDRARDSETLSPAATGHGHGNGVGGSSGSGSMNPPQGTSALSLFTQQEAPPQFNYNLPVSFNLPSDNSFPEFDPSALFKAPTPDSSNLFKSSSSGNVPSSTPNFASMFGLFDTSSASDPMHGHGHGQGHSGDTRRSPISPPIQAPPPNPSPTQPELLTRLKSCCHLSDSHVVNDPGLLIFATRLCQSFPCAFGGVHPDASIAVSDSEHLLLEDSWRALKGLLDPGGEADGENRINTGRMAAELVIRAAHSRGSGGWILCRFREGMTIKRPLISALVQGLGGKFD